MARVNPTTARRWKRGVVPVPAGILLLLIGDLGCFDPAWSGWCIRHAKLYSPEGWEATPGQILATRLHEIQLTAWRTENRELKRALAEWEAGLHQLVEQPTPEEFANSLQFVTKK